MNSPFEFLPEDIDAVVQAGVVPQGIGGQIEAFVFVVLPVRRTEEVVLLDSRLEKKCGWAGDLSVN